MSTTVPVADRPAGTPLTAADIAAHAAGSYVRHPAGSVERPAGFRIMRTTEVAPGWWGTATEVGETASAIVAYRFCKEQNVVTMNPNRSKRIEFYTEPTPAATS